MINLNTKLAKRESDTVAYLTEIVWPIEGNVRTVA